MAFKPQTGGGSTSPITGSTTTSGTSPVKQMVLWFVGAVVLIALAGPFPGAVTMLLIILIVLVLTKNINTYTAFFHA